MPRHQPPLSDDLFALSAPVIGPTVAAWGIVARHSGLRADLPVREDVMAVRTFHNRIDRGRIAEHLVSIRVTLLEPEVQWGSLFTSWGADDLGARQEKKSAFPLLRCPIRPGFEMVGRPKWPHSARNGPEKTASGPARASQVPAGLGLPTGVVPAGVATLTERVTKVTRRPGAV